MTPYSNTTPKILELLDRRLWEIPRHPLHTLKSLLEKFYTSENVQRSKLQNALPEKFRFVVPDDPITNLKNNFDDLLVKPDHVSRQKGQSFYLNEQELLRTHTSCYQITNIKKGNRFCVFGDVYRRDEIDRKHYPAFHQMEAVALYNHSDLQNFNESSENIASDSSSMVQNKEYKYCSLDKTQLEKSMKAVVQDLKQTHENLIRFLLNNSSAKMRWIDGNFPFTEPSFELEVFFNDDWVELLGCGVIHRDVIINAGKDPEKIIGWASGIGLERFAMLVYNIPDIRLFWSKDERFINQFSENKITAFQPFSKYPFCYKDVSFWVNEGFEENDLMEVVREEAGEIVESVKCVDKFLNKKTGKSSCCYRISYRSLERTLENSEIDVIQMKIREALVKKLKVELR